MAQLDAEPLPEMQQLIHWLESHVPAADSDPSQTRISHGDYRCRPVPCILHMRQSDSFLNIDSSHLELQLQEASARRLILFVCFCVVRLQGREFNAEGLFLKLVPFTDMSFAPCSAEQRYVLMRI